MHGISAVLIQAATALLWVLICTTSTAAPEEIYRCILDDGSISFQELPCSSADTVEEKPVEDPNATDDSEDEFFKFNNPYDNPPADDVNDDTARVLPSADRADCEQVTRVKIDAIDVELAAQPPREKTAELLTELMQLTRQLRACKTL